MMRERPAVAISSMVRVAAGPLALLAFLLPWTHGPGALAGESYSGFDLVRLVGVLQGLHLPAAQSATLLAARACLVAIPVAALWLTVLAPAHRWHWGYPVAASYLVTVAVLVATIGILRGGLGLPMPGPALLIVSAAMLLAPRVRFSIVRLPRLRVSRRQAIPQA